MNDEADKKGNTDLDIFSFRENKSFSLPQIPNSDKVSEENGTKSINLIINKIISWISRCLKFF